MSRFYTYWIICIVAALWSGFEKVFANIQHRSLIPFWVGICVAIFFWMCAMGARLEDKSKADDNPF